MIWLAASLLFCTKTKLFVTAQNKTSGTGNETSAVYDGCDPATEYYSELLALGEPSLWTKETVRKLITDTHRKVLNNTATDNEDDVIDALIDLDPGYETPNTVRLLFRDIDFDQTKVNLNEGWRRGDLWPLSRGAGLNTKAATDVHSKRPVDWTVDEALSEYFWGTCGKHAPLDQCIVPAVDEENDRTADDTATDNKIKTPEASMRGDVARSVLYAFLRYADELGLVLKDCPPFNTTEYAYLSELLTWHGEDPVDDKEIERNNKACSRWQGNRNPFVDYPELVQTFYGDPDTIAEGTYTYNACLDVPTAPPTASPNDCSNIQPGDISVIIFNSDPVDQISFFSAQTLDESVGSIFVTDRAWNGTAFSNSDEEGVIEYTIPSGGVFAGQVFGYGLTYPDDNGTWKKVTGEGNGTFDLSTTTPDNIFVYCLNADDEPHFISALTYNGEFQDAGLATYTTSETALPETLSNAGSVALPFFPNYMYEGPQSGTREELIAAFGDPANYKGSNTPFQILTSSATQAPSTDFPVNRIPSPTDNPGQGLSSEAPVTKNPGTNGSTTGSAGIVFGRPLHFAFYLFITMSFLMNV